MAKTRKRIEKWQAEDAARLRALFEARVTLSQDAFGHQYEIGSQGLVSQYLIGHIPLNLTAAARFAKGLRCTLGEISPTLAALGEEIAGSLKRDSQGNLTDTQLDLIEGYENAPPDARLVISAAIEPFLPKRRRGAKKR